MNAKTFIDEFDLLAAAPNGIKKLRELILQLAVQGKLISGDRNDYMQVSLRDVSTRIHYGYTASANHGITAVRLLRITDIQDNTVDWDSVPGCQIEGQNVPKYELHPGDILIARTGGTIGKTYLVTETPVCAVFASYLIRVIPSNRILSRFLKLFLESPDYWVQLREKSAGTGQPNVNGQALGSLKLDLPPLAEQKRIVAKVDELMRLCDELETRQKERNEKCVTLNGSCLNALLDIKDSCPANSHTERTCHAVVSRRSSTKTEAARRRIHDNFDILYDNPENVTELRKAILTLALQGRLTHQNSREERAPELLTRLRDHRKHHLMNEFKMEAEAKRILRKLDEQPQPSVDEPIPPTWSWSTLLQATLAVVDCHNKTARYKKSGIPIVRTSNIRNGLLDLDEVKYVSEDTYEYWSRRCPPEPGDLLVTREAPMGEAAIIPPETQICLGQRTMLARPAKGFVLGSYILVCVREGSWMRRMPGRPIGSTVQHLRVGDVEAMPIPVPPFAEQQRIVNQVEELMALCDALEAKLIRSREDADALADAVVHHLCNGDAECARKVET